MKINDVAKKTGLTRKAIEYYVEKSLVNPVILENGYREFSDKDIERLSEIATYRKLGLSIAEIKDVLKDHTVLADIINQKNLQLEKDEKRKQILEKIYSGRSISEVNSEIESLERKMTILEKLVDMFPGYYGSFFSINFARYLNGEIENDIQKKAFVEIVDFLDNAPKLEIPKELQVYLEEYSAMYSREQIGNLVMEKENNIENFEKFMEENRETIEEYMRYKQSEEFKTSPHAKLADILREFCETSGYYEKFIPAMRKLSSEYNSYYEKMLEANERFVKEYPETSKW